MLQSRMWSSLARLVVKPNAKIIYRQLKQAVNASMPPIISVFDEAAVETAARLILNGKVIALPTDTIYGISASAQNNNGICQLYKIKKRDEAKPIAICVGDVDDIHLYGETSHLDDSLLQCLLPGPVTIVLKRKNFLNPLLNPHTDLIGIRIPKFPFIQNLTRTCGVSLALTSANLSSQPSPLQVSEFCHLWPYLGGVFDGGTLGGTSLSREGSTVIDLSEPGCFNIIRSGSALKTTLKAVKKFGLLQKSYK